ncbi:MAG TPA: MFS transporter [Streptosporangiaceae bacterium]
MMTRDAAAGALVPRPALRRTAGPRPVRMRRWLGAGAAACVVGWGANQFTPMLLLYRARLGLSAPVVEAMFGMYAIGLVPGLLLGGSLSDRIGRRRVVVTAVALSMVAAGVLAAGAHVPGWLFAGRLIMGLASGGAFSAGAAWIKELSAPPYEDAPPGAGARRAGGAMTLGFAAGPLVAGVLAQWAPLPAELPYLPQLALAAGALALAAQTPETVPAGAARRASGGPWQQLRTGGLAEPRLLRVVLPLAPWVFGSVAVAMVYVPGLVAGRVTGLAVAFAAAGALATALSGVLVQPLARRLAGHDHPARPRLLTAGLGLVTAGLLAEAGIASLGRLGPWQPVLVLLAAAVLGSGYGICLVFGLAEVARLARPGDLAGLTAVFQVASYTGFAVPFLLSLLRPDAPAPVLLLGLAALAAVTLAGTAWQARRTAESPVSRSC